MKPAFSKYASAIVEHDDTGTFLASASDEELSEVFKEMHVSVTHKVELREAVAVWRADPQRVLFPLYALPRRLPFCRFIPALTFCRPCPLFQAGAASRRT